MIRHILQVVWSDLKSVGNALVFLLVLAAGFGFVIGLGWIVTYLVLGIREDVWLVVAWVSACLMGLIGYVLRIIEQAVAARRRQEVADFWAKIRSEQG